MSEERDYIELENVEPETDFLGVVDNCEMLNVREQPSKTSSIVCVISNGDEVCVDLNESTSDFYKVTTELGLEGYCMRKYIKF